MFHMYVGVRAGGGIGDEIEDPAGDEFEVERIVFDITFFFFVIVILLAIIQGESHTLQLFHSLTCMPRVFTKTHTKTVYSARLTGINLMWMWNTETACSTQYDATQRAAIAKMCLYRYIDPNNYDLSQVW